MSKELKPWEKIERLEMSVIQDTPAEVAEVCRELGKVDFTARALGIACRFRGLDMVKVLVENGATFAFDPEKIKPAFRRSQLVYLDRLYGDENYSLGLLSSITRRETYELDNIGKSHCGISLIPSDERLKILDYLSQNAEKIAFAPDEFLFYAYLSLEWEMVAYLKDKGVCVSEKLVKTATEGGNDDNWLNYSFITGRLPDEQFIRVMNAIIAECGGKKLHFTDHIWYDNEKRFEKPEFCKFMLENFNQSKMNKTKLLKKTIDRGSVECLALCAEHGWLKMPRKRDEMIQYATEKGRTECVAWLLDFKSRSFDLAAERAKAEKRKDRELNADPNSLTQLKKNWRFEKRGDGSIIITGYKGDRTEVFVPEKIGEDTVTAIGELAFSPNAPRLTQEKKEFRKRIAKIRLPNSITEIGIGAFYDCRSLTELVIPDSVNTIRHKLFVSCCELRSVKLSENITEISDSMFEDCEALESITIPRSVLKIGEHAFCRCYSLKEIIVPDGVVEIGFQAFAFCEVLKKVVLPASVQIIDDPIIDIPPDDIFYRSPLVTAVVVKGSYAEEYCEGKCINFVYRDA